VAVTQKQLGEMAGTSRESANRTLNAWEARGLVSLVPGRVTLRDEAAIRAIAEGGKQHG
jgi:CRP-like cAMP-binding protein